jgi:chaperonin GroES
MHSVENVMDLADADGTLSLDKILDNADNVAEILSDDLLAQIGRQVVEDYKIDRASMEPWLAIMEQAFKLASQMIEAKTVPWDGASNVKHSLILEACIQFAARAVPELIRDGRVVKTKVFGKDPEGAKAKRSARVEEYMNYNVLQKMDDWEGDLDKLCHILPMVGTVFKKTYYCPIARTSKSVLCLPDKITVNQNTKKLSDARRITHTIELYDSQITERVRAKVFRDVELQSKVGQGEPDNDSEHVFYEQCRYLDLDQDGYPEAYIVTVHEMSETVVRIVPCFGEDDIVRAQSETLKLGKVISITHADYYSDFHFIPAVEGTFFSYGFGYLLSHGTHMINTMLNQIIDAASLDNLQSGFIGKGARVRGGQIQFSPGKWVKADASGVDLKNSIVPLPTKGPSAVLFSLVQFLLQSYYRMISISDIMSGQISGSNTTAAEAMAAVEQGLKVMNSIHRRIYRGLKKEFYILFLNAQQYLTESEYAAVLDDPEANKAQDFATSNLDLVPVADSSMSSQIEEVMRLRAVLELLPVVPELQRIPLVRRLLTAMRLEGIDEILPAIDPSKPSQQQQEFAEQLEQRADELNIKERELAIEEARLQLDSVKLQYEVMKISADTELALAKAQTEGAVVDLEAFKLEVQSLAAKAQYIQAVTPDRGRSTDGQ